MRKSLFPLLLLLFVATTAHSTPLSDREQDSTYRAVRSESLRLQGEIEQLSSRLEALRREFRETPERRDTIRKEILQLESSLSTLRQERSRVATCFNTLEQERIKRGIFVEEEESRAERVENRYADAPRFRNLIDNACFKEGLPSEEYSHLAEAQRHERTAAENIERYAENYALMLEMQQGLITTQEQAVADSLYDALQELEQENKSIDGLLRESWGRIYDNKSYAYSYLLDSEGLTPLLEECIELMVESEQRSEALYGEYSSDALVDYFVQKPALVEWESRLADHFGLVEARDSLRGEAEYLASVEYRLPHLIYERRYLLEYTPVEFSTPSKYNTRNPIPECEIFDHGTIYRIRLGSYKYQQQPNIFRGVYPLAYLREEGRYVYYAGGYATKVEARLACEILLDRGFKRPEIVRWVNGVKEEVAMDEPESLFRIEIEGVINLSEEVKSAIRRAAPERELARVGGRFTIGTFDDRAQCEAVMSAIRQADPSLEVKVVEVKK